MFLSLPAAAAAALQPALINIGGRAKRGSEGRRSDATLAARFIGIFAPGMWQVLLGYL